MAHIIEDDCVSCARCDRACPEHCIFEGEEFFVIDAERCTDCGDCVAACPVGCIAAPPGLPGRR